MMMMMMKTHHPGVLSPFWGAYDRSSAATQVTATPQQGHEHVKEKRGFHQLLRLFCKFFGTEPGMYSYLFQ